MESPTNLPIKCRAWSSYLRTITVTTYFIAWSTMMASSLISDKYPWILSKDRFKELAITSLTVQFSSILLANWHVSSFEIRPNGVAWDGLWTLRKEKYVAYDDIKAAEFVDTTRVNGRVGINLHLKDGRELHVVLGFKRTVSADARRVVAEINARVQRGLEAQVS